jgi:hypothetical protein
LRFLHGQQARSVPPASAQERQDRLRDLSDGGARLKVPTTVAIPDRFTLIDAHARTRWEATVVWRKGDQIGVV